MFQDIPLKSALYLDCSPSLDKLSFSLSAFQVLYQLESQEFLTSIFQIMPLMSIPHSYKVLHSTFNNIFIFWNLCMILSFSSSRKNSFSQHYSVLDMLFAHPPMLHYFPDSKIRLLSCYYFLLFWSMSHCLPYFYCFSLPSTYICWSSAKISLSVMCTFYSIYSLIPFLFQPKEQYHIQILTSLVFFIIILFSL